MPAAYYTVVCGLSDSTTYSGVCNTSFSTTMKVMEMHQCYVMCTLPFLLIQKWRGPSLIRYIMLFTLISLHSIIWRRLLHSKYIFKVLLYQAFISYLLLCCLHFSLYRIIVWKIISRPMPTVNVAEKKKMIQNPYIYLSYWMHKQSLNNYFGGFKRNNDRSSQLTVVSTHIDISYLWRVVFRIVFPEFLFSN